MTHSFQIKEIHTYIGKIDVPPEDAEEVEAYLKSVEYDDYDLLIQLCDALALPEGPVAMEKADRRYYKAIWKLSGRKPKTML